MLNNFVQRKEFFERRPEDHPTYGEEWKVRKKIGLLELVYLFSLLRIRIRIGNTDLDPGGPNWPTKVKKFKYFFKW
jgi:hypothetical protein